MMQMKVRRAAGLSTMETIAMATRETAIPSWPMMKILRRPKTPMSQIDAIEPSRLKPWIKKTPCLVEIFLSPPPKLSLRRTSE